MNRLRIRAGIKSLKHPTERYGFVEVIIGELMRQSGILTKVDRYERPWGFGNTAICSYDPVTDKVTFELELDRASAIYSNAETPGTWKDTWQYCFRFKRECCILPDTWECLICMNLHVPIIQRVMPAGPYSDMIRQTKKTDYFGIPALMVLQWDYTMMKNGIS